MISAFNDYRRPAAHRHRAAIGGEALNATFGPVSCPSSAMSSAAASKLPPSRAKRTNVGFVARHFLLLHDNYAGMGTFPQSGTPG